MYFSRICFPDSASSVSLIFGGLSRVIRGGFRAIPQCRSTPYNMMNDELVLYANVCVQVLNF